MNNGRKPILLVEDNPMDADLTLRSFARRNVSNPIELARDGEEALAFIQRWEMGEVPPMAILLDVNLPKMNGMKVLQVLEAHPLSRAIPIILMLSSEDDREMLGDLKDDFHPYIVKPVSFEKFSEIAARFNLPGVSG